MLLPSFERRLGERETGRPGDSEKGRLGDWGERETGEKGRLGRMVWISLQAVER